jgi:phasin family protein
VQKLLTAKDAQEFFSLSGSQAQPTVEKGLAYSRHLAGIVSNTQAELTKAAEAQLAEANRKVISLIDEASKNAPAGTENAIAFVKTTIGNFNAGYEQFTKSAKQAAEALEANVSTAVDQLSQATVKATGRGSKK